MAPPAANDWFWNVPRLEYTASGLAPEIFARTEGASGTRRTHCRSPPGWSNTCAFAGAQMAQATTIALASNERRQGMAHLLRSGAVTVPVSLWANGGVEGQEIQRHDASSRALLLSHALIANDRRIPRLLARRTHDRRSMQINARHARGVRRRRWSEQLHRANWRPQGDSNPGTHRERVMS